MSDQSINEPLLDLFIFETEQLIEQLEQSILSGEKESDFTQEAINEIFRIMHTIKGSSAMMMFDNISTLSHAIEDLFYYLREEKPHTMDFSALSDLIFEGIDFIKAKVEQIKNGEYTEENAAGLIEAMKQFLSDLKQNKGESNVFQAIISFEEGCEMENIRAYTIIRNLKALTDQVFYIPDNIIENDESIERIRQDGFKIYLRLDYSYEQMYKFFMQTIFLKDLELVQLQDDEIFKQFSVTSSPNVVERDRVEQVKQNEEIEMIQKIGDIEEAQERELEEVESNKKVKLAATMQSIISVSVAKLDMLMDLVGEMVVAEAMVIQNPDLQGLDLENFNKAARQLHKITSEMQDMVMSIRMVSLSTTFNKMHRIVRDMCKKLDKEVRLEIIGEETEVDKNIIEHISDPLMHLVRNAVDHGIEEKREETGKPQMATVTLEAQNSGSDVLITVKDDGIGLDREKILKKAKKHDLLYRDENDMTDKEVFNLILLPGFSTNDQVTEFSGRGVGMDVVAKNIEKVGGSLFVDSITGKGTTITLKIPLTLAIIDGMNIKVGKSCYTIPTISIKESFRPKENEMITDPDGNEMIMVRGQCYKILRLHKLYKVKTDITHFVEGIIIMVEQADKTLCIFADELIGQQQVVVKALPEYIQRFKNIRGLGGCTLLGDGSISLILDTAELISL